MAEKVSNHIEDVLSALGHSRHATFARALPRLGLASGGNPFKAEQLRFDDDFARRGRLALINAGATPGVTNLLEAACADTLDEVDQVRIRLFEETEGQTPIPTWSAEVAHDAAISRPGIYRDGRFRLARRFSQAEWFRFPRPISESGAVLTWAASERSRGG